MATFAQGLASTSLMYPGSIPSRKDTIVFAVNGERFAVSNPDPTVTLNDFIRTHTAYKGTKLACGEGGCGACAVILSQAEVDPDGVIQTKHISVNSCLRSLCSMDGNSVTTSQGLCKLTPQAENGDSAHIHPIHERIAQFHGSQCGFCTPGMSISIYGALRKSLARGESAPRKEDMEESIDGNLCRCTGYRPILDAAKSFSADGQDIEDLVAKGCCTGICKPSATGPLSKEMLGSPEEEEALFPKWLRQYVQTSTLSRTSKQGSEQDDNVAKSFNSHGGGIQWIKPRTLDAASEIFQSVISSEECSSNSIQIVCAGTSKGIYKTDGVRTEVMPKLFVDVSSIPELSQKPTIDGEFGVRAGANTTIADLIDAFTSCIENEDIAAYKSAPFIMCVKHMKKIASHHVRNIGSIAGNLMLARKRAFESDLATVMCGMNAVVSCLVGGKMHDNISLIDFLQKKKAAIYEETNAATTILVNLSIPFGLPNSLFRSYKVALRPQNSHALVNAAMHISWTDDKVISDARIVYGAVGKPTCVRASATDGVLLGGSLKDPESINDTFVKGLEVLRQEIHIPTEGEASHRSAGRNLLVQSFFVKFFSDICIQTGHITPTAMVAKMLATMDTTTAMDKTNVDLPVEVCPDAMLMSMHRPVSKGTQAVNMSSEQQKEHLPVSTPIPKLSAPRQAAGRAEYTDDVQLPANSVYAALALTDRARVKITAINVKEASKCPGVMAIITGKDIPGENRLGGAWWKEGTLAEVGGTSEFAGQPVAIVVADTQRHAITAAAFVHCDYEADSSTEGQDGVPILTNADAVSRNSFWFDKKGEERMKRHWTRGDIDSGLQDSSYVLSGAAHSKSQSHFYMEPHTAWAIPGEDSTMKVGSSMQWPNGVQASVAKNLGISMHKVEVVARRVGGGFGGKLSRHVHVATSCAIAAKLLRRPVRLTLDRNTDMTVTGGRHAMDANYTVGFEDNGLIKGLKVEILMNSGWCEDLSDFCVMSCAKAVDQVYRIENLDIIARGCKTNLPTRTAMRGPGEIQASYIIEEIISGVAMELFKHSHSKGKKSASLSSLAHQIRTINMYPDDPSKLFTHELKDGELIQIKHYTMPKIWDDLAQSSDFDNRCKAVDEFNADTGGTHPWRKRGIAMTPVKYYVGAGFQSALVNVYSDGTIRIAHSGVEIGQGIHTKVVQAASYALAKLGCDGFENGAPLQLFHVTDTNSTIVPNMSMTGGSTTSEAACAAVQNAVDQLVERLLPVVAELRAKDKEKEEKSAAEEDSIDPRSQTGDCHTEGVRKAETKATALTWTRVVSAARGGSWNINLSSQGCFRKFKNAEQADDRSFGYHNFGAAVSEVEVDVLTGETTIVRSDILYDCGKSLNPAIDLGQCEGGFLKGVGFFLREDLILTKGGRVDSNGTWEYKPPCAADVPLDFRVCFMRDTPYKKGILSSKASGEPPLVLATSVFVALKHAIHAARVQVQNGDENSQIDVGHFALPAPVTPDRIIEICGLTNSFPTHKLL